MTVVTVYFLMSHFLSIYYITIYILISYVVYRKRFGTLFLIVIIVICH